MSVTAPPLRLDSQAEYGAPSWPPQMLNPDGRKHMLAADGWLYCKRHAQDLHQIAPINSGSGSCVHHTRQTCNLRRLLRQHARPHRMVFAASHLSPFTACQTGALARGDACLFLRFPAPDYREKIWDHAAGAVIVTESGGRISDGSGAPLDFGRGR